MALLGLLNVHWNEYLFFLPLFVLGSVLLTPLAVVSSSNLSIPTAEDGKSDESGTSIFTVFLPVYIGRSNLPPAPPSYTQGRNAS